MGDTDGTNERQVFFWRDIPSTNSCFVGKESGSVNVGSGRYRWRMRCHDGMMSVGVRVGESGSRGEDRMC